MKKNSLILLQQPTRGVQTCKIERPQKAGFTPGFASESLTESVDTALQVFHEKNMYYCSINGETGILNVLSNTGIFRNIQNLST